MKPQFVTAIYTGLEGTIFNGNSAGILDRYCQSLHSLAKGGYSIVCYTSKTQISALQHRFSDVPNLKLVVSELSDNPFHHDINYVKSLNDKYTTDPAWRSRCVEIMWGKFFWLQENLKHLDDSDNLFWIDAGIFHGGLITNRFRSSASVDFYDFDLITQHRNLHEDLIHHADGKIVNILSERVNHGQDDYLTVFPDRAKYGVIGGIFGGGKPQLQEYIDKMIPLMRKVLSHNVLLKEEEIMYYMHQSEPSLYTNFMFNSWYHDDWELAFFNPEIHVGFSIFFKVISE